MDSPGPAWLHINDVRARAMEKLLARTVPSGPRSVRTENGGALLAVSLHCAPFYKAAAHIAAETFPYEPIWRGAARTEKCMYFCSYLLCILLHSGSKHTLHCSR